MNGRQNQVRWFEVMGDYGQGWEMVTSEDSRVEAFERMREYEQNEPGVPFKVRRRSGPAQ